MKKCRVLCLLLCLVLLLGACTAVPSSAPDGPTTGQSTSNEQPVQNEQPAVDELRLHVIDVGQGDSTFVELPGGKSLLVDAGERDYGATVTRYIRALGYHKIDFVVGSHPHSDHIGGLAEVIEAFEIGQVWMPNKASTTATFEKLLRTIKNKGLKVNTAVAGKVILEEEGLTLDILSPVGSDYGDEMNLYSAVIRIIHGSKRLLIMGDAEAENEAEMSDVAADFIRVGHHGSKTSSSAAFVKKVGAQYAVISVGKDNSYGLPKDEIIARWQKAGAKVYRTDQAGHVIACCDGKTITVESKAAASLQGEKTQNTWVLNTSSKKIHRPDCTSVASMKETNKQHSNQSADQLLAAGYTPCGSCDPLEN